jgi:hypothetical protein
MTIDTCRKLHPFGFNMIIRKNLLIPVAEQTIARLGILRLLRLSRHDIRTERAADKRD